MLVDLIENKRAKVNVWGMGYVGFPLAIELAKTGHLVKGVDAWDERVEALGNGIAPIHRLTDDLQEMQLNGHFSAIHCTDSQPADVHVIAVPTPLNKFKEPDLSYVESVCEQILPNLQKDSLVVLESTTYPGTTSGLVREILERDGLRAGKDFHLAYSPERVDPANTDYNTEKIPKIVGGYTSDCLLLALKLYKPVVPDLVPVSSCEVAESAKLLENIYRSVNIALVNELKVVLDKMGIDIWEVIDAAKTKPFGFKAFYPSAGVGGHCIPIDPFYLSHKAKEFNCFSKFIELAGEVNITIPKYVFDKVRDASEQIGKPLNQCRVCLIGVAYKPNIDDVRESPAEQLLDHLKGKVLELKFMDDYVKEPYKGLTRFGNYEAADIGIIVTAHDNVDHEELADRFGAIVDTCNVVEGAIKA